MKWTRHILCLIIWRQRKYSSKNLAVEDHDDGQSSAAGWIVFRRIMIKHGFQDTRHYNWQTTTPGDRRRQESIEGGGGTMMWLKPRLFMSIDYLAWFHPSISHTAISVAYTVHSPSLSTQASTSWIRRKYQHVATPWVVLLLRLKEERWCNDWEWQSSPDYFYDL